MLRRLGLNRKNVGVATLVVAFLFCVYLYYDLHHQLKLTDERNQRLKSLQNSMSTQLQVVYEHKTRLERVIQDEKENHRKTREGKLELEAKMNRDKLELQNRIQTMNQKQRILQTQMEDLQKDVSKAETDYQSLKDEHQREIEDYKEKILVLSQQCDSDRKFLKDELTQVKELKSKFSQNLFQCQESLKMAEIQAKQNEEFRRPQKEPNRQGPESSRRVDQDQVASFNASKKSGSSANVSSLIADPDKLRFQKSDQKINSVIDPAFRIGEDDKTMRQRLPVEETERGEPARMNPSAPQVHETVKEDADRLSHRPAAAAEAVNLNAAVIDSPNRPEGRPEGLVRLNTKADEHGAVRHPERDNANGVIERPVGGGGGGVAINVDSAVIDAPNRLDGKAKEQVQLNKKPDEDDDQEEDVRVQNGQNEGGDQREEEAEEGEEDYQYDKNDRNEEKAEVFPDAKPIDRDSIKIRNPVYPDDVEVVHH